MSLAALSTMSTVRNSLSRLSLAMKPEAAILAARGDLAWVFSLSNWVGLARKASASANSGESAKKRQSSEGFPGGNEGSTPESCSSVAASQPQSFRRSRAARRRSAVWGAAFSRPVSF